MIHSNHGILTDFISLLFGADNSAELSKVTELKR